MRKVLLLLSMVLTLSLSAQVPQKMSYQSVIRGSDDKLLSDKLVGIQLTILRNSASGVVVYAEAHQVRTNVNGLASLEIGGGNVVSGSFANIDWGNGPYFIQTKVDPNGGNAYTITVTSQFMSVPYALFAENSGNPGPQGPRGPEGPQGIAGADGAQGPKGDEGPAGKGVSILGSLNNATELPTSGNNGDAYLVSGDLYVWTGTAWENVGNIQGPKGDQGIAGADGVQGPQGIAGADGIQGPKGDKGDTGADGAQGIAGADGAQGPKGDTGADGKGVSILGSLNNATELPVNGNNGDAYLVSGDLYVWTGTAWENVGNIQGPKGEKGDQGIAGADGAQGPQGLAGAEGVQGPEGIAGADGIQGPKGDTGADGKGVSILGSLNNATELPTSGNNGDAYLVSGDLYVWTGTAWENVGNIQGPKGEKGDQGIAGADGAQGPQGPQGIAGTDGIQGTKGDKGDAGADGADGAQGLAGADGAQGPKGDKGDTGADGKGVSILGSLNNTTELPVSGNNGDAYLVNGDLYVWTGTAWENVGNIQGPKGDQGIAGADGAQGPQGIAGIDGIQGPKGDKGDAGAQGPEGIAGADGAQGPKGDKGDTGADGAQGPIGNQGIQGIAGTDGAQGPKGDQGIQGEMGPQGLLPDGSAIGNTTFWNGTDWVIGDNNIYNNGSSVGIGTNDPSAKLDVNGQIRLRGGTPGSGKVLTSDANGLASWQDATVLETGTLNAAYNAGGSGQGREIIADSGAVKISGIDGFLVIGEYGQGENLNITGYGTRMFFYPKKGAFRAGRSFGDAWNDENIGRSSFAVGEDTEAKGDYSTAMGAETQANGSSSTAMGTLTQANGYSSTVMGYLTVANGESSTAMGEYSKSNGYSSLVIGRYNDTIVSAQTSMSPTTPLFIIGNGTYQNRTNAIVVRNDGRTGIATSSPNAQLHVAGTGGLMVTGTFGSGATIVNGSGSRMFFNPRTGAFRAGETNNNSWNAENVGNRSFAVGLNSKAKGAISTAIGADVEALSAYEIALGRFNTLYTPVNATGWNGADRLLVVGNGEGDGNLRSDAFAILKNGQVGIRTASPEADLHIVQTGNTSSNGILLQQSANVKWRIAAGSLGFGNRLYFNYNGANISNINSLNGDYTTTSDIRLKKDITPLNSILSGVMALKPVTFRYKSNPEDAQVTTGFIAQEVQALFPDLVSEDDESGYLSLSKSNFGVLAIKAIQELKVELDTKSTEVEDLKQMILSQQAHNEQLMQSQQDQIQQLMLLLEKISKE